MLWHVFNSLFTLVSFGSGLLVLFVVVRSYLRQRKADWWPKATPWNRLLFVAKDSATILWSYVMIFSVTLVEYVLKLADTIGDPQLSALLQQYLTPNIVGALLIGSMFVTILARGRTL